MDRRPGESRASLVSPADEAHLDLLEAGGLTGAQLGVAILARGPHRLDRGADVVIARAGAHERAEVVALCREEAGVQRSVRRQAGARAVGAERPPDRRDGPRLPCPLPGAGGAPGPPPTS